VQITTEQSIIKAGKRERSLLVKWSGRQWETSDCAV
jgi:hypothetical protein